MGWQRPQFLGERTHVPTDATAGVRQEQTSTQRPSTRKPASDQPSASSDMFSTGAASKLGIQVTARPTSS